MDVSILFNLIYINIIISFQFKTTTKKKKSRKTIPPDLNKQLSPDLVSANSYGVNIPIVPILTYQRDYLWLHRLEPGAVSHQSRAFLTLDITDLDST